MASPSTRRADIRIHVEPRIRRVVADQLAVSAADLVPALSLTDELAADSLDILELVLSLESTFDIAVPEPAVERMRSYGDVVDAVVSSLLNGRCDESA